MFKKISILLALVSLSFVSNKAIAATDGTLGTSSAGTKTITVSIPTVSKISGLTDFSAAWSGSGDIVATADDLCVFSNATSGNYKVKYAINHGSAVLNNGTDNVAIAVAFDDSTGHTNYADVTGATGAEVLTYNTDSTTTFVGNATSSTCGGSTNATIAFTATEAALQAVTDPNSNLTATMTVTVTAI